LAVAAAGVVVLAFALLAVSASGASDSPWDVPVAPIDPAQYVNDPLWIRSQAQALARERAEQQRLASTAADVERDRSRSAYDDLSGVEARDLAQQNFPELVAAPLDGLDLPAGVHVDHYLSTDVARVEDRDGKHSLVVGTAPLATPDASGHLSAVDLSLSPRGDHLVPENAAVDVALPRSADDPLSLPNSDIDVTMAGAADVPGVAVNDRAQVLWQLRSPAATESPSLNLELPSGATARVTSGLTAPTLADPSTATSSIEIVRDNAVVGTITPPHAYDADGVTVSARYRLDGDRLIVDVPHRQQEVRYPVMVDPEVHEVWGGSDWDDFGAGPSTNMAGRWRYNYAGPGYYLYNGTYAGRGLFIRSWPGAYNAQNYAQFSWGVPGYVNIMSVWFDGLYHVTQGDHLFFGIVGPYGWETVNNIYGDTSYAQDTQTPDPAWETARATIGVWEDMTVTIPSTDGPASAASTFGSVTRGRPAASRSPVSTPTANRSG
jgi:hypothetical protein